MEIWELDKWIELNIKTTVYDQIKIMHKRSFKDPFQTLKKTQKWLDWTKNYNFCYLITYILIIYSKLLE